MLFAVKRIDLALPILCSLGLGIFLCLLLISGVTFALKEQIYRFAPRI